MKIPAWLLPSLRRWFEKLVRRTLWRMRRYVTGRRFQTVVFVGRVGRYNGDVGRRVHLWGVNFAYKYHPGLDRVYALDSRECFKATGEFEKYAKDIDALGVEFVGQEPWPEIKNSRGFPLDKVRREVGVLDYYTSTIAYMFVDAIREGYGTIVVHQILSSIFSKEYYEQKACLDFWAGVAIGYGIEVLTSEASMIATPYPWQSDLYGYISQDNWLVASEMVANTMKAISHMPRVYRRGRL